MPILMGGWLTLKSGLDTVVAEHKSLASSQLLHLVLIDMALLLIPVSPTRRERNVVI